MPIHLNPLALAELAALAMRAAAKETENMEGHLIVLAVDDYGDVHVRTPLGMPRTIAVGALTRAAMDIHTR